MGTVVCFGGGMFVPLLVVWDQSSVGRGRALDGRIGDAGCGLCWWSVEVGRQVGELGLLCRDFCGIVMDGVVGLDVWVRV